MTITPTHATQSVVVVTNQSNYRGNINYLKQISPKLLGLSVFVVAGGAVGNLFANKINPKINNFSGTLNGTLSSILGLIISHCYFRNPTVTTTSLSALGLIYAITYFNTKEKNKDHVTLSITTLTIGAFGGYKIVKSYG